MININLVPSFVQFNPLSFFLQVENLTSRHARHWSFHNPEMTDLYKWQGYAVEYLIFHIGFKKDNRSHIRLHPFSLKKPPHIFQYITIFYICFVINFMLTHYPDDLTSTSGQKQYTTHRA